MSETPQDRVLEAAAEEFAANGYTGSTVRRIANRCGMSTGSLFNRYASKRELLVAVVAEGTVRADALVRSRLHGVEDPLARLQILVVAHLESLHGASSAFTSVAWREIHLLDEDERRRVVELRDAYEHLWQQVVDDAADAGYLSDDPLMRLFLLGAVTHSTLWYRPEAGIGLEELGARFVALAVHARDVPDGVPDDVTVGSATTDPATEEDS